MLLSGITILFGYHLVCLLRNGEMAWYIRITNLHVNLSIYQRLQVTFCNASKRGYSTLIIVCCLTTTIATSDIHLFEEWKNRLIFFLAKCKCTLYWFLVSFHGFSFFFIFQFNSYLISTIWKRFFYNISFDPSRQ